MMPIGRAAATMSDQMTGKNDQKTMMTEMMIGVMMKRLKVASLKKNVFVLRKRREKGKQI